MTKPNSYSQRQEMRCENCLWYKLDSYPDDLDEVEYCTRGSAEIPPIVDPNATSRKWDEWLAWYKENEVERSGTCDEWECKAVHVDDTSAVIAEVERLMMERNIIWELTFRDIQKYMFKPWCEAANENHVSIVICGSRHRVAFCTFGDGHEATIDGDRLEYVACIAWLRSQGVEVKG